jgi:dTDP-4-dehydrorhamnose reductase
VVNVIILGKGFVGNHIFNLFKKCYNIHTVIVNRVEVDYFNEIALKKFLRELHCYPESDVVFINCSGYTGRPNVDACESNKEMCVEYNTKLPVFLSNFCQKYKHYLINVSSGCIYSGYEKEYTEEDVPNFGMYSNISSFYSKTKHLAELLYTKTHSTILRIRMPFCSYSSERSIINKIINYDNLVSYKNSLTSLDDLTVFINKFIVNEFHKTKPDIYNVVNPGGIDAKEIVQLLSQNNIINKNWKFVDIENLQLKANRSNCVLSSQKIADLGLDLPPIHETLLTSIEKLSHEATF